MCVCVCVRRFPKMRDPQVIIVFNTKPWSNDLDDLGYCTPMVHFPHGVSARLKLSGAQPQPGGGLGWTRVTCVRKTSVLNLGFGKLEPTR